MFWDAGAMVKLVMLLLLFFSVYSWFIVFRKQILYKKVRNESENFLDTFWNSKDLSEAYQLAETIQTCPEAAIFRSGYTELQKIGRKGSNEAEATLEMQAAGMANLKRILQKTVSMESSHLGKSLPFLATTGSATPFIGLFGTVWGIMTSFREIGIRGSASLAVVAPGISEALVATAAGLAVAIPAVIFYNYYSSQLSDIENNMENFSADFLNLVERDLISRR
ncbi:MAG: protein TolQ [Desulfobulbaceae bacterium]|uniref:Protein TolQ n=1 Tax=Candidatus Desulfobia pelagia TaxID=2841692 RepID=A0A8J6TDF3_9BACT|nr:protein TolQ [Candidatus Desulfobia pelagia]